MSTPPAAPPPRAKKHIAFQLADFSLFAPIVAIAIGVSASSALNNSSSNAVTSSSGTRAAWTLIGSLNLALLILSVLAGAVALCFIPKLGARKILGRSIAGILISGALLAALVLLLTFFPTHRAP